MNLSNETNKMIQASFLSVKFLKGFPQNKSTSTISNLAYYVSCLARN